jgi:aspartyl-tRNA(Asn)/glutamyl-tRNA(Gln) amidotransferase subunit A
LKAYNLTLTEASKLIRRGELSPRDLLEALLDRIESLESSLHAWVTIDVEGATTTAEKLSKEAENGEFRGTLHGIPIGVKDIFYTKGLKASMGSPIFHDFIPQSDAFVVSKLKKEGAIVLGKTETTEFALTDPAPTRNPWNTEHTPGGSSSGSSAAVSSGMCQLALGSQTGGSVIRPASFCGVVGLKPTYDLINRENVYPLSWTLDHVGFFTRSVEDSTLTLEAVTGNEYFDDEIDYSPQLGFLGGFFHDHADAKVWKGFEEAIEKLKNAGANVSEVELPPSFDLIQEAHRIVMASEVASVHEEFFKTRKEDYRIKLRSMISSGLLIPASAYLRARRMKTRIVRELEAVMKDYDCLITPSAPTPALKGLESTGDAAFNAPWSYCGFPTITVPSGLTADGLPLGLQLVDRFYNEGHLLNTAAWCEKALPFNSMPVTPR